MSLVPVNKHYCSYPFSQITTTPTGQYKLCCSSSEAHGFVSDFKGDIDFSITNNSLTDFWNSSYMEWVRENHIANKPIKECEACAQYEANGNESYRQRAIKELGYFDKALPFPRSLDLKLGNRCNAKCLFCDPSSSSQVYDEWKELGWDKAPPFNSGLTGWVSPQLFEIDYDWAGKPTFWNDLLNVSEHIQNLKFTGGEPLVNRYMIDYLTYLVEKNLSRNIRLQITTNGISVPTRFLKLLEHFREIEINFSVDGFGKQNEYIRFPTKWESWLKNLEKVQLAATPNTRLHLQHSFSFYSVFGLEEYFEWMWPKKDFGFHLFKVYHPEIQQPELLDIDERIEVVESLENLIGKLSNLVTCERDQMLLNEIKGLKSYLATQEDKSHLKPKLKDFLTRLDRHRNISIVDYLPRVARALNMVEAI